MGRAASVAAGLIVLAILAYAAFRLVRHYAFPAASPPTVPATYGCSGRLNHAAIPTRPIIAFGDSITWGQGASRNCLPLDNRRLLPLAAHLGAPDDTSYPADLSRLLHQPLLNYGVRGERTDQGLARLRRLLPAVHPSALVLMEGTNDVLQGRSLAAALANVRAMLSAVRHVGARALLLTPPPLYSPAGYPADSSTRLDQLAKGLQQLGRRLGVPVVDVWHAFVRHGGDARLMRHRDGADDRIHPNDAGYRLIARAVAGSIRRDRPDIDRAAGLVPDGSAREGLAAASAPRHRGCRLPGAHCHRPRCLSVLDMCTNRPYRIDGSGGEV